jgi:hypothetical protein
MLSLFNNIQSSSSCYYSYAPATYLVLLQHCYKKCLNTTISANVQARH